MIRWSSQIPVNITGVENMTYTEIIKEVEKGGRFVNFYYCFSIIVFTSKRPTNIYFIRSDESAFLQGLGPTLITIIFGWWGIPFGIIYTIQSLIYNLGKDKDKTDEIMSSLYSNLLLTNYKHAEINNAKYINSQSQETQNEDLKRKSLFCKYCGRELPDYALFCNKCGKEIKI